MNSTRNSAEYETVIGLEVHIQLNSQSKIFCPDQNAFSKDPNTNTSVISLAHPGTLPSLNREIIEKAVKLGLAIGAQINRHFYFDRKNYFYADLPKGYQISQKNQPVCTGGSIRISSSKKTKSIRIHHVHIEEDAGKMLHHSDEQHSLLDFNRAGVPLLELVTEPDLRSSKEVHSFIHKLRQLVRYLEISDGNMEEGSLRCDCNISVRPVGATYLGKRCEIKNLNSARYAQKAVEFEAERQIKLILSGGSVSQETREFLPESGVTRTLRSKEDAPDYRYFPEPDLPPIALSEEFIDKMRHQMPPLPEEIYRRFRKELDLSDYDATILTETHEIAFKYLQLIEKSTLTPKLLANFFINQFIPYLQENKLTPSEYPLKDNWVIEYLHLISENKITASVASQLLLPALLKDPQRPLIAAQRMELLQHSDEQEILRFVREVISESPQQVRQYIRGKKSIITYFIGQVMRKSGGSANPGVVKDLLSQALGEIDGSNHG